MPKKKKILEKIWINNGMDVPFFLIVLLVLAVGLILQLSAGAPFAYSQEGDSFSYIKRQSVFAVLGLVFAYIVSRLNYRNFKLVSGAVLIFCMALLGYTSLGGGDINRWVTIAGISFQPSEPAKLALIMFLAFSLSENHKKLLDNKPSTFPVVNSINKKLTGKFKITTSAVSTVVYLAIIGLNVILILKGSHLSGAILVLLLGIAMLWMAQCKGRWFVFIAVVGIIGAVGLVWYSLMWYDCKIAEQEMPFRIPFIKDYMTERVVAWVYKDFSPDDARWQVNNSLAALGSGGLLGAGIGNSKQKYLYVAECHTDFIFSIIGEELGFIGCVLVIILFVLLIGRGIYIGLRAKERSGALLVFGIMAQLAIQIVFNIAVITDTVPNTGIPLPFFSYGGTALVIVLVEMGMVLSVSRQANLKKIYVVRKQNKTK